jgi:hypothetical protein
MVYNKIHIVFTSCIVHSGWTREPFCAEPFFELELHMVRNKRDSAFSFLQEAGEGAEAEAAPAL